MLYACIKSEQIKIKRSFIWIAFVLTPLIPALMGTQNYLNNLEILQSEWASLWTQETLFYSNFFFAPLIAIYCSYLWRMENQNKNRHLLLTQPVPVRDVFLGKLVAIIKITLFTQFWIYVLYLISGKLVSLPGIPPAETFTYTIRGLLGGVVIAALQLLISMVLRSFAAPIAIAVMGSITGLLAANSDYGVYYPYSLMMLGMNTNKSYDMLSGSSIPFFISCLFYLLLFCCIAVLLLKHRDVNA